MRTVLLVAWGLACSTAAWAQTPTVDDDFDDSEFEGPEEEVVEPGPTEELPLVRRRRLRAVPLVDDVGGVRVRRLEEGRAAEDPSGELSDEPEAVEPPPTLGPGSLAPASGLRTRPRSEPAAGARPPPPPEDLDGETGQLVTEASLREALERRATAMRLGDLDAADVALGELIEVKQALGLRNIPMAAAVAVHESRVAMEAGQFDRAVKLAEAATRAAPDLPGTHWMLVTTLAQQDATQVVQITYGLMATVRSWLLPFRNAVTLWVWVMAAIGTAVVVVGVGYAGVQLIKYLRYPAHDLSKRVPGIFGTGELSLLLLALVLTPFALGFGVLTTSVFGLGVVFAYQTLRERAVSALVVLGISAIPWALEWSAPFVVFHGSDVDMLATAYSENVDSEVAQRLEGLAGEGATQRLAFARINAHRARQRGDLGRARLWYEAVIETKPSDPAGLNNLAVLQFLDGEEVEARGAFERAARSKRAEPRLNLSLLLADEGRFDEADALLVQARQLDPVLTESFTDREGARAPAQRFVEVPLPETMLWTRLFETPDSARREVTRQLWAPVGGDTSKMSFSVFVLACVVLAALLTRRRPSLSVACTKCGRPADGGAKTSFCEQCISVFVTAVAVEPAVRQRKELEVRRHQRRRRWLERLLSVAGLGLAFGDRPFQAVVMGFVIAAAISAAVFLPLLEVSSWTLSTGDAGRNIALGALSVVAVAVAVESLRRGFQR